MKRRQFVFTAATFAFFTGCGVLPNLAKPATPAVARVGILDGPVLPPSNDSIAGLKQGLVQLGYMEGQNVAFELRDSDGWDQLLPNLANETAQANELIKLPVDVIVALASGPSLAAQQATTVVPVVFVAVTDPVGQGFVASLDHPGGNLTGVTNAPATVFAKQLEFLNQVVPHLSRVAWIANFSTPGGAQQLDALTTAVNAMGVQLRTLDVRTPEDVEPALAEVLAWKAEAMMSPTGTPVTGVLPRLIDFQVHNRIPLAVGSKELVQAGVLLTYDASYSGMGQTAASLVDKVIKGARPADLPVEQPTMYELAINQTTAQMLGITIPLEVAQQVTTWFQ